ncbi:hypothetical protein ABTI34_18030, partial [Acinetobacter baumannii]
DRSEIRRTPLMRLADPIEDLDGAFTGLSVTACGIGGQRDGAAEFGITHDLGLSDDGKGGWTGQRGDSSGIW